MLKIEQAVNREKAVAIVLVVCFRLRKNYSSLIIFLKISFVYIHTFVCVYMCMFESNLTQVESFVRLYSGRCVFLFTKKKFFFARNRTE